MEQNGYMGNTCLATIFGLTDIYCFRATPYSGCRTNNLQPSTVDDVHPQLLLTSQGCLPHFCSEKESDNNMQINKIRSCISQGKMLQLMNPKCLNGLYGDQVEISFPGIILCSKIDYVSLILS